MSLFEIPNLFPWLVAIVLAITGLVTPPSSVAEDHSTRDQIVEQLSLTPPQVKRISAYNAQYAKKLAQLSQNAKQADQELTDLILAKAPKSQVQAKQRQLTIANQQLASLMNEKFLAVYDLLSAEQLKLLSEAQR